MPDITTWRKLFKQNNIDFLSGDVTIYNSSAETPWTAPITVAGDYATIAHMAAENNLYIIPEAQDMTLYNGIGRATVTLSPTRNDVVVTLANEELDVNLTNEELDVNVTNEELDVNITNEELDVNVTNAEDFPSGGGGGLTSATVTVYNNYVSETIQYSNSYDNNGVVDYSGGSVLPGGNVSVTTYIGGVICFIDSNDDPISTYSENNLGPIMEGVYVVEAETAAATFQ